MSIQELEEIIYGGNTSNEKLSRILSYDYSKSGSKSYVTERLLMRDPSPGLSAAEAFNRVILHSGLVRDFILKHKSNNHGVNKS